jgi:hypothetical protein
MSRGKKKYLKLLNKIKMILVEKPEENKHRSKENPCGNKFVFSCVFNLHTCSWFLVAGYWLLVTSTSNS